jgi:hypothetical protein
MASGTTTITALVQLPAGGGGEADGGNLSGLCVGDLRLHQTRASVILRLCLEGRNGRGE